MKREEEKIRGDRDSMKNCERSEGREKRNRGMIGVGKERRKERQMKKEDFQDNRCETFELLQSFSANILQLLSIV